MNLEEKKEFIKVSKEKNYLYISPRIIKGGATLVDNYETLELYENMDDNTSKFAEKEIINLISNANDNNKEVKNYLDFNLIFCGDFNDLPNDMGNAIDFIMNNKERIVAVYRYIKDIEQRNFFVGFPQTENNYKYGYLYLNLAKLLEEFDKNNIKYEIDTTVDRYTPSLYRDDASTKFVISYNLEKDNKKRHQLKKVKKRYK
ncbi:MAG TPA: hypothetical protein IAB35_02320 [Candidatus Faecimonas gallistercoris]|nr:hypothetical protein [Candidatus Faecimonas gallistercoris]